MNPTHRAAFRTTLLAVAVMAITYVAACAASVHDDVRSRRAEVEVIRRDQLGVSSVDNGVMHFLSAVDTRATNFSA